MSPRVVSSSFPVVRLCLAATYLLLSFGSHPHAQAGRGAEAAIRPTIPGGLFEASGAIAVPGSTGALVVDDGLDREVLWVEFDAAFTAARARRVPLGVVLVDQEDITTDGTYVYSVGSQSKGGGRMAVGLVRYRFDPAQSAITSLEVVRGLQALASAQLPELGTLVRGRRGPLNIEGLTWDGARARLVFGLRTPQENGRALLLTATLRDATRPLSNENLLFGPTIVRLDLGGLSVRGLGYDEKTARVLIVGGPAGSTNGASRVFEWDGSTSGVAREVAQLRGGGKPEGITRVTVAGRTRTLIVYDAGQYEFLD